MTVAPHDIDPARFLHEHLAQASPDLLRDFDTRAGTTEVSVPEPRQGSHFPQPACWGGAAGRLPHRQ